MAFRILIAIQMLLLVNVYCAPKIVQTLDNDFQAAVDPISTAGCGSTKGCILHPPQCNPSSTCNFTFTYAKQGNNVRFEISVLKPEKGADFYGAVGFNNDPVMARASVIACTYDSSVAAATVSLFHNPPPQGENNHVPAQRVPFGPADPALLRLEEAAVINNRLVCRYTRNIAVPSNKQSQVYPLNAPYHILLARGQYDAKNKQLTHHDERIINAQKVDVTQPPRLI